MGDQTIKTISVITALLGLAVIIVYFIFGRTRPAVFKVAKIGAVSVNVEVVESLPAQQRGLSGRPSLSPDSGMLFVYKDKDIRHFWMPDMHFPLDVLWISDSAVVGLQENIPFASTNGSVPLFQSNVPVDMVLEVNAGWIAQNKAKIGDLLTGLEK